MYITVMGSYPKLPESGGAPNIRRAIHQFEAGQLSVAALEQAVCDTIARVIAEQEQAGVDVVTDGQIRWDDLVTPVARDLGSVEIGGLVRFFDTNTYYRRPIVKGRVWFRGSSLASEVRFARSVARARLKAALPGPFTLMRLSLDEHYRSPRDLMADLAQALHLEAQALVEAGAQQIQFDEPALLFDATDDDWRAATEAIEEAGRGLAVPVVLGTYFRDASEHLDDLAAMAVDAVALDVTSGPAIADRLATRGFARDVVLGLVDGREWRIEKPDQLARIVEKVGARVGMDHLGIAPSCGLEFLTQGRALAKLRALKEAADLVSSAPARPS